MDIVLRSLVIFVFVFVFVLVRAMGRRELSELQPFDVILLVVLGDLITQGELMLIPSVQPRSSTSVAWRRGAAVDPKPTLIEEAASEPRRRVDGERRVRPGRLGRCPTVLTSPSTRSTRIAASVTPRNTFAL